MKLKLYIFLFGLTVLTSACEGFLGKKTDTDFIDPPVFQNRDVAYVPIQPSIEGFASPSDIIIGFDGLIYVVDEGTEEIISLDVSGRELGRINIPGVTKIAQDRRLDILAIGTFDTVINDQNYTLSTIYRLDLNGPTGFGIQFAQIERKLINPFYLKSSFSEADVPVEFTSVDILADNEYYVTRQGERSNVSQVGGPDDAVIFFDNDDNYVSTVFISTGTGLYRDWFRNPSCITTFIKPPQNFNIPDVQRFFVAMTDPIVPVKVQAFEFVQSEFGADYELRILGSDTTKSDDFLYRLNRFEEPVDMTITGDGSSLLFVVDAAKDSVYQFTLSGLEGVEPPPGASSNRNVIVSFGGTGQGPTEFNRPSAVAYDDEILYVADQGNGRILRFRLTTDFD